MFRAFVISVAVHLLLITSLSDRVLLLPVPPSTEGVALRARLGVRPDGIHSTPARHGGRRTPTAPVEARPWSAPDRQTKVVRRASARGQYPPSRAVHSAVSQRPTDLQGESVPVLPADVEREFRLLLARRLRHVGSLHSSGGKGTVKLSIAYYGPAGGSEVRLMHSSGDAELDAGALSSLKAALRDASLPQAAQGRSFRMSFVLECGSGD